MTDTREATPSPAMEARERLENVLRQHIKADAVGLAPAVIGHLLVGFDDAADAILKAFHLSDAAALALMDGEGAVVPKEATQEMLDAGYWPCVQRRGAKSVWQIMSAASPYKETTNDR